jgi:hypothetical protein
MGERIGSVLFRSHAFSSNPMRTHGGLEAFFRYCEQALYISNATLTQLHQYHGLAGVRLARRMYRLHKGEQCDWLGIDTSDWNSKMGFSPRFRIS